MRSSPLVTRHPSLVTCAPSPVTSHPSLVTGYWITQKGSSTHPRRSWTGRDLLDGVPIQHFSLAVGPSAQRGIQPGDGVLIYWPGAGSQLFMGTFEAAGPVELRMELPEGWPYA